MKGDRVGGPIRWRMHIPAPPEKVYAALDSDEGRASFWAESASEVDEYIETRVLIFLAGAVLFTTLLSGILPALRAGQIDMIQALKTGTGEAVFSTNRLRALLVVGQLALACILLVGSALFWRSYQNARSVELGFEPSRVVIAELPGLDKVGYGASQVRALHGRMAEQARRVSGVEAVAIASSLPFGTAMAWGARPPGWQGPYPEATPYFHPVLARSYGLSGGLSSL